MITSTMLLQEVKCFQVEAQQLRDENKLVNRTTEKLDSKTFAMGRPGGRKTSKLAEDLETEYIGVNSNR